MVTTGYARQRSTLALIPLVGAGVAASLPLTRIHHGFAVLLVLMAATQAFASLASP